MDHRTIQEWRKAEGFVEHGGAVLAYGDEVQGWINDLSLAPLSWKPGTLAFMEDGTCFIAKGGTDYDGALYWELVEEAPEPARDDNGSEKQLADYLAAVRQTTRPSEHMAGLVVAIDDHDAVFSEFRRNMAMTPEESCHLLVLLGFQLEEIRDKAARQQPGEELTLISA